MPSRSLAIQDLHPLHFAILKVLPAEGQVLGYHKMAKTAKQVTSELNKHRPEGAQELTSYEVSAALRSLHAGNFVVNTKLVGAGLGWQSTSLGKEALSRESHNEHNDSSDH